LAALRAFAHARGHALGQVIDHAVAGFLSDFDALPPASEIPPHINRWLLRRSGGDQ
jgi:hypothetical protein